MRRRASGSSNKPGTVRAFFYGARHRACPTMPDVAERRRLEKLLTLLGFAVFVALIALAVMPHSSRWPGELRDPDVKPLLRDCGNAGDPPGSGMPAWPDGKQRYYTRQQWSEAGELKVEVWELLPPGHVLVSADREVKGNRIVIAPRWEVPPGGAVAACVAKFGVEVRWRGLPRGSYVIDAR